MAGGTEVIKDLEGTLVAVKGSARGIQLSIQQENDQRTRVTFPIRSGDTDVRRVSDIEAISYEELFKGERVHYKHTETTISGYGLCGGKRRMEEQTLSILSGKYEGRTFTHNS